MELMSSGDRSLWIVHPAVLARAWANGGVRGVSRRETGPSPLSHSLCWATACGFLDFSDVREINPLFKPHINIPGSMKRTFLRFEGRDIHSFPPYELGDWPLMNKFLQKLHPRLPFL